MLGALTYLYGFILTTIRFTTYYYPRSIKKLKFRQVKQHVQDNSPHRSLDSKRPGFATVTLLVPVSHPLSLSPITVPLPHSSMWV